MPTQTGSIDFTSAGGLKSYAAGQFATQGAVTDMQTQIGQNAEAITLRATKTEVQQVRPAYASSSTAAGTAAKVATIDPAVTGYALYKGASVAVTFSTANTAATPTLNLNSTGAKQIRSYTGAALSEAEYKWAAGATIDLVYDGTYWRMQDGGSVKRVTAAEASISVNAENIESKVSKDGVISSINQSAETVTIDASRVEVDGTAVFTAISSNVDNAITGKGYQTASQVESAITSKGYATTAQAQEYADAVQVGGRNLLKASDALVKPTSYDAYDIYVAEAIESGQQYVLQLWDVDVSHSAKTAAQLGVNVYYCGGSVALGGWIGTNYFTNGHADRLTLYFTAYTSGATVNSGGNITGSANALSNSTVTNTTKKFIRLYNSVPTAEGTRNMSVGSWKLEKGNKATDWTPAPEDLASAVDSVEYIAGTQTAATGSWTGVTRDSSLYTGKTIAYKLPYAGSGSASLQLKDSSGNNVGGNIAVYSMTTRVTTHYPAGSVIQMTYDGTYWRTAGWYNSNNYDRNLHNNFVKAAANVVSGQLVCGTSAGYKPIAASATFDMSYPILWAGGAWTSGTQYANAYETYPSVNPATTATVQGIAVNKMVYVKGQISGNTFTCAASNFLTCTVPTSEDGYFYLPVGIVANDATTKMYFNTSNDLYAYLDGKFRQVTPTEIMASQRIYYRSKVSGTVPKPTAWITLATNKYNDTVSVGNSGWSTKVTPIAASKAESVAKYLYLYTCEQRKRLDGTVECTTVTLDENTTIIDGGNIITHTVTAEQLNATSINASKSLTVGAMTNDAANTILNSRASQPNLAPFFSMDVSDSTYWYTTTNLIANASNMGDGWASFAENSLNINVSPLAAKMSHLKSGTGYTALLEVVNSNVDGKVTFNAYTATNSMIAASTSATITGDGEYRLLVTTKDDLSDDAITHFRLFLNASASGASFAGDVRLSLYEGEYSGPYKPYSGSQLYATSAELKETNSTLSGAVTDIAELDGRLHDEVSGRENWLRFNSDGLVIGDRNSAFYTSVTESSMEFHNGDTVLATASGSIFDAPSMKSGELHFGDTLRDFWMWTIRNNGNLSLKWIGPTE